ncbi:MAG TPA: NUDIX domain-containing protein [bacterium]|nr:NUDIX domain-containing protein [bacterium]
MKTPLFTFSDAYLAIASPGFAEATIGPLARREAKRPAVQAVTYCTSRKTVLLLRDNHGNIELPGGGMKSSENTETAIRRELLQEAGIGEIESIAVIARSTEIRKRTNFQQNNTGLLVTVNNPAVHTTHLSKRELATG